MVDSGILGILRQRYEHCMVYEAPNHAKCKPLYETYEQAAADWFCKCKYRKLCYVLYLFILANVTSFTRGQELNVKMHAKF